MPPFRYSQHVRFGDVDHAGIVYYPNFFHFFHVAFEEMFSRESGPFTSYRQVLSERKIGFPAVRVECDFKRPLRFGDTVDVEVTPILIGGKSVTFKYTATLAGGEAAGPVAVAKVTCAVTDMDTFRAVPVPDDFRKFFESLR